MLINIFFINSLLNKTFQIIVIKEKNDLLNL